MGGGHVLCGGKVVGWEERKAIRGKHGYVRSSQKSERLQYPGLRQGPLEKEVGSTNARAS